MSDTCPTCGDRLNHAGLPSSQIECATRVTLIEALQTYAEGIDGEPMSGAAIRDLFGAVERRTDGDLFTVARVCEVVIGLGWRPKAGAS
jgi:hypothetical protein